MACSMLIILNIDVFDIVFQEFISKYPAGKLDKDGFIEAYKQLNPQDKTTVSAESVFMFSCRNIICLFIFFHRAGFNLIDKNHDGTIDFNEFLFFVAVSIGTGSLDERLDLIFDLYVIQFFERVVE